MGLAMPRPCAGGGPWGFSWAGAAAAATRNRTVVLKTWALFLIGRRNAKVRAALYLLEVLSAVGKSLGTGMVTEPVAAHSVPRWSSTM